MNGAQSLAAVDVQGNLATTGTAIVGSSLQAAEIMSVGRVLCSSWGSFGTIPTNAQTGDLYALNLYSTNIKCSGSLTVNGQAVAGGAASASVGDVLKSTRTQLTQGNVQIPTSGA